MTAHADHHEPAETGWHLDRRVPLSLIFAMLLQAGMVIWAIADIKKDVEVLKSAQSAQLQRDERQDKAASDSFSLVRDDIKEVKAMLVRLIDRADRIEDLRKSK